MVRKTVRLTRILSFAAMLVAPALAASPAFAQATITPKTPTAGVPSPQSSGGANGTTAAKPRPDRTESEISYLYSRLHITTQQDPLWQPVAQALRDNDAATQALIRQRAATIASNDAVQNLDSYQKLAAAYLAGLQKFSSVFQTLYQGLTPDQKKEADYLFRSRRFVSTAKVASK